MNEQVHLAVQHQQSFIKVVLLVWIRCIVHAQYLDIGTRCLPQNDRSPRLGLGKRGGQKIDRFNSIFHVSDAKK